MKMGINQITRCFSWMFWGFVRINKQIYSYYESKFFGRARMCSRWLHLFCSIEEENNSNYLLIFHFHAQNKVRSVYTTALLSGKPIDESWIQPGIFRLTICNGYVWDNKYKTRAFSVPVWFEVFVKCNFYFAFHHLSDMLYNKQFCNLFNNYYFY